jgi:RNA polymerase sigma-70 factor, ECF subfamily
MSNAAHERWSLAESVRVNQQKRIISIAARSTIQLSIAERGGVFHRSPHSNPEYDVRSRALLVMTVPNNQPSCSYALGFTDSWGPGSSAKLRGDMKELDSTLNTETSEAEAIEKAKKGDVCGYETLYHLHQRRIYSLCLRATSNVFDAEDLTQDVFLQMYRKLSTFRGDAKFGSWLYRVALNFVLMHLRQRRLTPGTTLPDKRQDPFPSNLRARECGVSVLVERLALGRAISSLPRGTRKVVLLHDVEGYTHSEVAECLGLAVGTSKSQLHKAHLALRGILGPRARSATLQEKPAAPTTDVCGTARTFLAPTRPASAGS